MNRPSEQDIAPRLFDGPDAPAAARDALAVAWADPPGLLGALSAINHKTIARRFMLATFMFFVLGGLFALAIRLQLARPDSRLVGPGLYDQMFTMHGTTMMFLFAVPVMQAVATFLVPLMIGARSVAFPRMNAYAFWVFLFGGLTLYGAFAIGSGPGAG
jgi:cytochrome c oxidase subunit I+III